MTRRRKLAGLPLLIVGLGLAALGLARPGGGGGAFVGSGVTFAVVGIALLARARRADRA